MFLQIQLAQDLSVVWLCLMVLWLVVGPPTASRRIGGTVGVFAGTRWGAPMANHGNRAPTLSWWLVLFFVSTSHGGPKKLP